jgi:hypothetical protein
VQPVHEESPNTIEPPQPVRQVVKLGGHRAESANRMCQQSYREDLVDATAHPSAVSPDAER